jgi:alanine dehydrogenase
VETIRPTTLPEPVYTLHGVLHYGVTNMPALVPRTSTFALTNATLPYALDLARKGALRAVRESTELARGVNVWRGRVVCPAVAAAVGETSLPVDQLN